MSMFMVAEGDAVTELLGVTLGESVLDGVCAGDTEGDGDTDGVFVGDVVGGLDGV